MFGVRVVEYCWVHHGLFAFQGACVRVCVRESAAFAGRQKAVLFVISDTRSCASLNMRRPLLITLICVCNRVRVVASSRAKFDHVSSVGPVTKMYKYNFKWHILIN